jgi:hypothetical protein
LIDPLPIRILLQTTIPFVEDDWHIGRFAALHGHLQQITDTDGRRLCIVTARDRAPLGKPDPVLSSLDASDFDELWLFAVDPGDGLLPADCEGIARFRRRGGGVLVARDHMDLGCSVCSLAGIGAAHFFHSRNQDPDPRRRTVDDKETPEILWPNYHSGANGDFQEIRVEGAVHPVLVDPHAPGGTIRYLPSHPHEGAVGAPSDQPSARVIATGCSKTTGARFNIAVAFEPSAESGPAIAQSTFHHFVDLNWNPALGCPSFVSEKLGSAIVASREAQRSVRQYVTNLALWLSRGRSQG